MAETEEKKIRENCWKKAKLVTDLSESLARTFQDFLRFSSEDKDFLEDGLEIGQFGIAVFLGDFLMAVSKLINIESGGKHSMDVIQQDVLAAILERTHEFLKEQNNKLSGGESSAQQQH